MTSNLDIAGYASLGDNINKKTTDGSDELKVGVVSEKLPELELPMSDEDIVILTNKWERAWRDSPKKQEWDKMCEDNEKYWLGKQFDTPKADKNRPNVDNAIFESLETFLPQATRRNPEPLITIKSTDLPDGGDPTPQQSAYVTKVKLRLADIADEIKFRLKLKKVVRHWAIFLMGVIKYGWDLDRDMPAVRVIRPKKLILDPDATIEEDGYTGNRIGEYRKMEAYKILAIISDNKKTSKAKTKINEIIKGNTSTEIQFIEWWTPQYFCWILGDTVLLKKKNPHWNYNSEEPIENVDNYGNITQDTEEISGINHLPIPSMPYSFLTVFNLGDQPMDKTSLIGQNLANQDRINKRNRQIDKNADRMNGGMIVSLSRSGLTKAQATNVTEALRKGGVVVIPDGSPRDAIDDYQPTGLPSDVFNQLYDTRDRLRDIFGTTGTTPSGIKGEETVRGKIITHGLDTDRIGGGVTEYLEQLSDDVYNWIVQLLYVYDTGFQFVQGARPPKIVVSIKEGSLLPKDSIAIANQALELAGMNRMSNIDLYKRLDYPNPEEMAANVWLEVNAPHLLYRDNPLVQEVIQMQQQAAQARTEANANKDIQTHGREIQKEILKGELKKGNERSLLSGVNIGRQ